jgi:hypothetical protein
MQGRPNYVSYIDVLQADEKVGFLKRKLESFGIIDDNV